MCSGHASDASDDLVNVANSPHLVLDLGESESQLVKCTDDGQSDAPAGRTAQW
jgi:hypothetical protein